MTDNDIIALLAIGCLGAVFVDSRRARRWLRYQHWPEDISFRPQQWQALACLTCSHKLLPDSYQPWPCDIARTVYSSTEIDRYTFLSEVSRILGEGR